LLERDVEVILRARVGEVAGEGDRERRAHLVRPVARVERGEVDGDLARGRVAGPTAAPSMAPISTPRPR
jgi:hypothetical protein